MPSLRAIAATTSMVTVARTPTIRPTMRSVELGIRRHDMDTCRYRQMVTVYIGTERFGDVFDKGGMPVGSQSSDRLCHWERSKMAWDELLWQWELSRLDRRAHTHVRKAGRCHEIVQLDGVMKRMRRSRHGGGLGTYVSRQRRGEARRVGRVADGAPHRESQPTAGAENSAHLSQCLDTIGKELESLLAKDRIEGTVLEW